ncbi:MAG: hypothetical protein JRC66_03115 [Deltaproteobacteria bacterium]|nr:hypothetical protein [Deltaproteobacteria bacterium]
MSKEAGPTERCKKCGKIVDSDQLYCSRCIIEFAEENITEPEDDTQRPPRHVKSRKKVVAQCIILLACVAIIAFQMPKLFAAFKEYQSIRQGTYETDVRTDRCINNLWHISKLLQDGRLPGNDIVCPASGSPYVIIKAGEDTVAHCPNPGLHGFSEISASRRSPCPEIKQ